MPSESESPPVEALRARLDEEEAAYSEVLAALDRLASFELPGEVAPEVRQQLERLNELWATPDRPSGGGLGRALRRHAWEAVAPALQRQSEFNAALVQLLNARLPPVDALHGRLRELAGALVHYAQRVQPLVDARGRVGTALATTRSELILEAFDRRIEGLDRRIGGLLDLGRRLETLADEVKALRAALDARSPPKGGASRRP